MLLICCEIKVRILRLCFVRNFDESDNEIRNQLRTADRIIGESVEQQPNKTKNECVRDSSSSIFKNNKI